MQNPVIKRLRLPLPKRKRVACKELPTLLPFSRIDLPPLCGLRAGGREMTHETFVTPAREQLTRQFLKRKNPLRQTGCSIYSIQVVFRTFSTAPIEFGPVA